MVHGQVHTHARVRERACMIDGLRTFSLSPTYLLISSPPLMLTKLRRASAATALASRVLLHPGGPYSSTPRGAMAPSRSNALQAS